MAIHRAATWPWASRMTGGTLHYKNLYSNTFGYTETQKKVAAASTTAVLAATAGATSSQTVTSGLTDPDVPRVLSVTSAGTEAHLQAGTVTVTGTNVEGKTITDTFNFTEDDINTTKNGTKAFRTVTSVAIPPMLGTGITFSVGTLNILGVNHRLYNQNTTVKVYSATTAYGALTLQAQPTVVADEVDVELNTVAPATTPNGTTFLVMAYSFDNWSDGSTVNDQPEYSTTTSTSSTSTSTSTSTITTSTSSTSSSTSSTSSSTSSTSSSTSSTSTSTSSTSTSTTTAP